MRTTRDVEALSRLAEFTEECGDSRIEVQIDELAIRHRLKRDVDRGGASVPRDQGLAVDRVAERALAKLGVEPTRNSSMNREATRTVSTISGSTRES